MFGMKNCFTLQVEDETLVLKKDDVAFFNGYGVFSAELGSYEDGEHITYLPVLGVVNQEYDLVLPLIPTESVLKINIFKEGNILLSLMDKNQEIRVLHATFDNATSTVLVLDASDYYPFNDDYVQLEKRFGNWQYYALYDVVQKKRVSEYFNVISNFGYNSMLGQEAALANYYITDNEGNIKDIIACFINIKGQIITNFRSLFDDVDLGTQKLDEAVKIYKGKGRVRSK